MTVEQADKIDQQFLKLKDSIQDLKKELGNKNHLIKVVDFKNFRVSDTNSILKTQLYSANYLIDSLKKENQRISKLEYIEQRTRNRITFGLVGTLIVWGTFVVGIFAN